MTTIIQGAGRDAGGLALRRPGPVLLALLLALPVTLALSWPSAVRVWQTGDFVNSDDATRAVQIRDWMAGQGWFDLSAHRMGLPPGVFSHWSRVVDVPVAALIRLFGLWLAPDMAERAARITWPLALQCAEIAAIALAGRVLAGPRAAVAAGLLVVLGGIGCLQFEPGRIHHHSPQILLLTLMTATTLGALASARARVALLTGPLVVLSLAIGLENLPFVAVILAVPPLAWGIAGAPMRASLLWFALGLAVAAPVLFLATVGPARYGVSTVDAYSLVHLAGLMAGAGVLAGLALATRHLLALRLRFAAVAGAGALVGGLLALLFPDSLHGPFYGMDPLLRPFWLDDVQEVRPLLRLLAERPATVVTLMAPLVCGALATAWALATSHGVARARWAVVAALVVVGFAGSVWAIRVASSLQPLALLGGAWAVACAWDRATRDGRAAAVLLPVAATAAFSSLAWMLLPLPDGAAASPAPSCLDAAALAPLAALPPGLAFAPIDAGPFLLAQTRLSVLAAPYHRDNAGNRAVIEGFLASPEAAHALVRATGARYLMTCGDGTLLEGRAAPDGLAAALAAGRVPAWLRPVPLGATPFAVYAVE